MTVSLIPTQNLFFNKPPALSETPPPRYQKIMEGDNEMEDLSEANRQLAQEHHRLRHQVQFDLLCEDLERQTAERRAERNRRKCKEEAECTIHITKMFMLWFAWYALIAAAVIAVLYIYKHGSRAGCFGNSSSAGV